MARKDKIVGGIFFAPTIELPLDELTRHGKMGAIAASDHSSYFNTETFRGVTVWVWRRDGKVIKQSKPR